MHLKINRKLKSIGHPSGFSFRRQQFLPAKNLTNSQKNFFRKSRFQFCGDFRRSISRRTLNYLSSFLNNNIKNSNKVINHKFNFSQIHNNSVSLKGSLGTIRSSLQNSLWIYQNPAAVPGAVKVRRFRQLNLRYRKSSQSIKIWLNKISDIFLKALFTQTLNSHSRKGYYSFIKVLESTVPLILMKLGYSAKDDLLNNLSTSFPGQSQNYLQYRAFFRNGQKLSKVWVSLKPGDYLTISNSNFKI